MRSSRTAGFRFRRYRAATATNFLRPERASTTRAPPPRRVSSSKPPIGCACWPIGRRISPRPALVRTISIAPFPSVGQDGRGRRGRLLFGNKLDLKLTRYDSSQLFNSAASTSVQNRIPAFESTLYNALINTGRGAEWSTVGTNGATVTTPYALPNGAIASSSAVSKGYALEVYFKPNRYWDFVASVDKTEARVSGIAPELTDFFATRAAYYKNTSTRDCARTARTVGILRPPNCWSTVSRPE